jgi:hypothetical protein
MEHGRGGHGGIHSFTITGQPYHRMGPLLPSAGNAPAFAQLYLLDGSDAQLNGRLANAPEGMREEIDPDILRGLQARALRAFPTPYRPCT